jgi:hypothetical protein
MMSTSDVQGCPQTSSDLLLPGFDRLPQLHWAGNAAEYFVWATIEYRKGARKTWKMPTLMPNKMSVIRGIFRFGFTGQSLSMRPLPHDGLVLEINLSHILTNS